MIKRILFTLILTGIVFSSGAQKRHSVGLNSAYMVELYPQSYFYRVRDIAIEYKYEFFRNRWCGIQATGQLHYTPIHFSSSPSLTEFGTGYELGFTVGLNWNINIFKDYLSFNAGGFIGPMYTPVMPARQGGWLNFSDNLHAGFSVKLYKFLYLDIRARFRHLSNAGFFKPNHGVNTYGGGIGLFGKF